MLTASALSQPLELGGQGRASDKTAANLRVFHRGG